MKLCHSIFPCVAAGVLVALMGGCAAGPDFRRPDLAKDYPSATAVPPGTQDIGDPWWSSFGAPALDARVQLALRNNPDVEAAQASLAAALENAAAQRGGFFPVVTADLNPTRQKTSGSLSSVPSDGSYLYSLHTAQLSVAYTPDLFGGNRRNAESLIAQADAQRYQWQATRLTLIGNLCVGLIEEASLRAQLDVIDQSVETQQRALDILQKRLSLGDAARSDVLLQASALAATQAQRPPIEKQWAQQRDRNAALEGSHRIDPDRPPIALADIALPRGLPTSVPSAWLERRPDVRAAEAQWHAASAQVGVAAAARLPSLTLTASAGSAAARFGGLFGPGTAFWNIAGDLAQPLFDGGALRHRERAAEAGNRQAAALYRSTVINAFANVADALHAVEADERGYRAALAARDASLASFRIGQAQLAAGDISVLSLLAVEQAWRNAELGLIAARAARLEDAAVLMQAIAGDG